MKGRGFMKMIKNDDGELVPYFKQDGFEVIDVREGNLLERAVFLDTIEEVWDDRIWVAVFKELNFKRKHRSWRRK